jgi:hypothetical protein
MSKKKKRAKAARKAAGRVLVTKSAARAAAKWAGKVACYDGHPNKPDARFCTECSGLMPGTVVPPLGMVGKSAAADTHWRRQLANSSNPADREMFNKAFYGQNGGMR